MAIVLSPTNFAGGKVGRKEEREEEERVRGEMVPVGERMWGEEAWGWKH